MVPASSRSRFLDPRAIWLLAAAALASVLIYLAASRGLYRVGFPLDDAWIHQTYARNLARLGEWSFLPGRVSGGSTAPLWSAWLALGDLLGLGPYLWAYASGVALLWALGLVGEWAIRRSLPDQRGWFPWAGLFMIAEWHMVWAAGSGMETLLAGVVIAFVLAWLAAGTPRPLAVGLLIGLGVWVRPDALTLLGPGVVALLAGQGKLIERARRLAGLLAGFVILFAPYLLFNWALSGEPWPTTYYAKQAEYAVLMQVPFWRRFLAELSLPVVGAGVLLLPGLILAAVRIWRERAWGWGAALVWYVGYAGIYAWRLPVTYQHGRYLMPAMPAYFLLGLLGALAFFARSGRGWTWRAQTAWKLALAITALAFLGFGARSYAQDVAVIESEMVDTARWVDANLPAEARIAAHDIGALGYFAPRDLLDLAGLISPDVIPFLRDEDELRTYLDEQQAEYLITFPNWYPALSAYAEPLFTTDGRFAPLLGGENMAVYRWPRP